ncbi:porin [Paraburkholderia susongensis]|uniref:Outer membrane protein (Porin) n=1 Tax=Paraburkholderia susongensis TaxID=1515439 RepID=A0A1X7L9E1_9BURK|nr:porin [Paraburkholderia susongensis]SMG50104.1 Outer membrane protein (porin) [Paraburkholderia susongensis]
MRKWSWAGAMLCVAPAVVYAQSSVTLYGLLDEGVTFVSNENGHSAWLLQSGGGSLSRWGIRGAEDLGGGYKAIFTLENGFDVSSGSLSNNGRLFGRQAYVGISSPYGTVTFGRQYEEVAEMLSTVAAGLNWAVYLAHAGDVDNAGGSIRINNSVKYASPKIAGFTFGGLYSFGGQPGQFSANSATSVGLSYTAVNFPLYIAAAYTVIKNPFAAAFDDITARNIIYAPYVPDAESESIFGAGASYKFGGANVSLEYTSTRFKKGYLGGDVRFDNYEANAGYFITPFLFAGVAYIYTHGKVDATSASPNYRAVDLYTNYFLTKRTDVYFAAEWFKAAGSATVAQITLIPSPSSGQTQSLLRIGIRHRF